MVLAVYTWREKIRLTLMPMPCYGLSMQGDKDRQQSVARAVRQGILSWALMHVFASAMLLYAIYKPDPAGVKGWAYALIAISPICVAWLYLETRAIWHGKDDTEIGASIAALSIAAALGALAWYLG